MRVGILGGTFNPIHVGHLVMAETAREEFGLKKVLFIPSAIPPHKQAAGLPAPELRLAMTRRAVVGNPTFEVCDLEIRRGGKSYSYDTLRELKARFAKDAYFFIIGSDSLDQLGSWHRIDDLRKLCRFIVVERPGMPVKEILKNMSVANRRDWGKYVLSTTPIGISSRHIRERVRRGLSVRYLVNESVEAFLSETGLYR